MASLRKIQKPAGSTPDELELSVAKAFVDLEHATSNDLAAEMKILLFNAAKEVEVAPGKKALVIYVPVPLLKAYRRIQGRLIRELEKKFTDRHVVIIASRRILPKPHRNARVKQMRPRSRTLTAVHDALLEDLVFPSEIVGKRIRYRTDGSRLLKVILDAKDQSTNEYKLDTFSNVYRKLTGKNVAFEFPVSAMDDSEKRRH